MYVVIRRDDTDDFVDVLATRSDKRQSLQVATEYAEKFAAEYDGAKVEPLPDTPGVAITDDTYQLESIDVIECKDTGTDPYVANKGNKCPYCGGEVETAGSMQTDVGSAWQDARCAKCGKEWTDVYTLTGWEPVQNP